MECDKKKSIPSPWESANPVSKTLFTWVLPLFWKGYSTDLTINDLHDAPAIHKSQDGAEKLQKAWDKVQMESKGQQKEPQFWRALLAVHKWRFLLYLVIILIDELFFRVVQPIYVRKLVQSFSDENATRTDQATYAGVVCLCSLFHDLMVHQCVYIMFRTGLLCRVGISSILFQKALRLRSEERAVGPLINLMSNDLARFDYQLIFMPYILVGPLQLAILLYILYEEVGVSSFAGAAFILIILPTQILNGKFAAKYRSLVAKQTDERSKLMNEIVFSIRVIKMYAWEKPFSSLLSNIRRNEVKQLGKRAYLRGFFLSLYTFSTRLTAFFVILAYVLLGNELTADKAFFVVAISLTIVETMVFMFSSAVQGMGECAVSIRRTQDFLLLPERPAVINHNLNRKNSDGSILDQQPKNNIPRIIAKKANASWTSAEKVTLRNLTFEFSGEKLIMVVGPVGCGKTSLLHLLISELPILEGGISTFGKISYASQEPFIFPSTVRQNILFGQSFNYQRYDEVVTACALKDDFNQLPYGDQSIVGERGITLSGGQKARINLARSLYRDSDITLLDDVLSAVDSKVSRHIFEKAIKGLLRDKLRFLATHQLQYLPQADWIILLNNGQIQAQGTYEELTKEGIDFVRIMSTDAANDDKGRRKSSVSAPNANKVEEVFGSEEPEDNSEKIVEGSVGLSTYATYFKSGKSPFFLTLVVLMFLSGQIILTSCEYWLSYWTDSEDIHRKASNSSAQNFQTSTLSTLETIEIFDKENYLGQTTYLLVYMGLVVSLFILTVSKAFGFFGYCLKISNNMHNLMFSAVVRAPTKFFDDNPSGRILNRFAKDIGSIDEMLPQSAYDTFEYTLQMLGVVAVIAISNYYLVIPTVVIAVLFWILRVIFVRTSRDVKRLESMWKSPVFGHVAASLQGLATIRALGVQDILTEQFDEKQDVHTAAWFAFISTTRCFAVWAETIGVLFMAAVTFSLVLFADQSTGGVVGLVVTSTLALSVNIQWAIRQSADMENHMTSVERAIEYKNLIPEAELEIPDKKPPSNWPSGGEISFEHVYLSYDDKDVLKDVCFEIRPKEKIGIVGRTGAGKSSIISALFRMTEPKGSISIDGVKVNEIGLHDLRKSISIIPQDPVLFSGSVRYNLDPFGQFEDDRLWEVLEQVQLKDEVPALDYAVSDGGNNFSLGQRQLVCLARAILRNNKIIVMDEATANVDPTTDEFIQKTIRSKFADCTIITIAHRLHSVMDCDRIMVLDGGVIMEYDHPYALMKRSDGLLFNLARHTGQTSFEKLLQMASEKFSESK